MTQVIPLTLNCIALTGYAFFLHGKFEVEIFSFLLLALPFLDRNWKFPISNIVQSNVKNWSVLLLVALVILFFNVRQSEILLLSILFVALPEEWFFRAYCLGRLSILFNNALLANFVTSILFAVLHLPIQGLFGLTVFFPSLFFGWLYQKTNDFILVVSTHILFNIVYILYIKEYMTKLF